MVFAEDRKSSDREFIVSVFRTRTSIFQPRFITFCRSSEIICSTSVVSLCKRATLSTCYGSLYSSTVSLRILENSFMPYILALRIWYWSNAAVNILRILSRKLKAILSEYLWSHMTKYTHPSEFRTQKMQLLAAYLVYFLPSEQALMICWAVSVKFPEKFVYSDRISSSRETNVYIIDIVMGSQGRRLLILLQVNREKGQAVGDQKQENLILKEIKGWAKRKYLFCFQGVKQAKGGCIQSSISEFRDFQSLTRRNTLNFFRRISIKTLHPICKQKQGIFQQLRAESQPDFGKSSTFLQINNQTIKRSPYKYLSKRAQMIFQRVDCQTRKMVNHVLNTE